MPDLTPAQRAIAEALDSHMWAESDYPSVVQMSAHANHRYDAQCAICRGDTEAIASAIEPVVRQRVAANVLRTEADRTETYVQDGGTGTRTRRRFVHDERTRNELLLRATEIETTTADGETT